MILKPKLWKARPFVWLPGQARPGNHYLPSELSRALEVDEIGSDPGCLPDLKEIVIVTNYSGVDAYHLFSSFMHLVGWWVVRSH